MRNPKSREFWEGELKYIRNIDPNMPGGSFNGDPECFGRYVRMQADFAEKDGFRDISEQMSMKLQAGASLVFECEDGPSR